MMLDALVRPLPPDCLRARFADAVRSTDVPLVIIGDAGIVAGLIDKNTNAVGLADGRRRSRSQRLALRLLSIRAASSRRRSRRAHDNGEPRRRIPIFRVHGVASVCNSLSRNQRRGHCFDGSGVQCGPGPRTMNGLPSRIISPASMNCRSKCRQSSSACAMRVIVAAGIGIPAELGDDGVDPRAVVLLPLLAPLARHSRVSYRGFLIGHQFIPPPRPAICLRNHNQTPLNWGMARKKSSI